MSKGQKPVDPLAGIPRHVSEPTGSAAEARKNARPDLQRAFKIYFTHEKMGEPLPIDHLVTKFGLLWGQEQLWRMLSDARQRARMKRTEHGGRRHGFPLELVGEIHAACAEAARQGKPIGIEALANKFFPQKGRRGVTNVFGIVDKWNRAQEPGKRVSVSMPKRRARRDAFSTEQIRKNANDFLRRKGFVVNPYRKRIKPK